MNKTRIILGIEYDGSGFYGWQWQTQYRSVQDVLEQALSKVANHPVTVQCAGRTDTGVHALEQVVHFDTTTTREYVGRDRGEGVALGQVKRHHEMCFRPAISTPGIAPFPAFIVILFLTDPLSRRCCAIR